MPRKAVPKSPSTVAVLGGMVNVVSSQSRQPN